MVLVAATILAYVNCFGTGFQFDDRATILEDPRLSGLSAFAAESGQMIRPLLKLSFVVDREFYGQSPAGYHLLNLLLHCGSGLLLFVILRRAGSRVSCQPSAVRSFTIPFLAALLFLLHPIQTETVTYISGRATGMAAFFSLLSLYLFFRAADAPFRGRRFTVNYAGALVSFVLALLSKEIAFVLPGLLLLWHAALRPAGLKARAFYLHAPFWAVLFLGLIAAAFHPRYSFLAQASLETRPVYTNLLTQINAVCHALTLFFLPGRLNFDHDLPVLTSVTQWPVPVCLALLLGMLGTALLNLKRLPLFAYGLLWFLVCLLPTNSFIPRYDILSERNLYLPSIGIFLAVVSLLEAIVSKLTSARAALARALVTSICILAAAGLAIATVDRNRVYFDQVTFWSDAARKSPKKARTHNNLGFALYEAGDLDRALREFRTALLLDPQSTSASENLRRVWKIKQTAGR